MALLHSILRTAPFSGCKVKDDLAAPRVRTICRRQVATVAALPFGKQKTGDVSMDRLLKASIAGVLASGILWLSPSSALADVQTVSPQMVTQMARPLPKQTVDKGKVWVVFIGGAIVLFGATLVLENNPQFFPAIFRANEAMREATKRIEEQEKRMQKEQELLRLRQQQYDTEQQQVAAVQQGMKEAKARVLGASNAPRAQTAAPSTLPPAAAPAVASAPTTTAAEPAHESPDVPDASGSTSRQGPTAEAEARGDASGLSGTNAAAAPYVVVEDAVPDMGALAWPSGSSAGPAAGSAAAGSAAAASTSAAAGAADGSYTGGGAAATHDEDAESLARLTRLQGFVSETMAGSKGAMEALKSQRQ